MAHKVKCKICGKEFDTEKEEYVLVSNRRYAHKKCVDEEEEKRSQDEKDEKELEEYIKKLFEIPHITAHLKRQINDYKVNYDYSYSGMLKTLIWWYGIQKNPIEKAHNSLGIIPYIYDQACAYYYSLYLVAIANENKDLKDFIHPPEKVIEISAPRATKKPFKLFNLAESEEN